MLFDNGFRHLLRLAISTKILTQHQNIFFRSLGEAHKKSLLSLAALASLACIPGASFAADDLSYSYVELDHIVRDIDLFEDDDLDPYKLQADQPLQAHTNSHVNYVT